MSPVQSFYEADSFYERLTLRLVRERIGHCLRERYPVPNELPAKLLALVRKLEAIESKSARAHVNRNIGRNRRRLPEARAAS